ncbi:MAG TPA: helix-turn-helix domain-containing protein [Actinocrinis sp.]|nr:helix-turn-helix domain-containing protein [Actinocrinis sp.]
MDLVSIGEFARLARLSPKALRLYDQSGLLTPDRVDPVTGYRWYSTDQLEQARLVAALRQIGVPLAQIKPVVELPPQQCARRVMAWWAETEADHASRRELAGFLVDRLNGRTPEVSEKNHEIKVRDLAARPLLCQMAHVPADELLAFGKAFIGRFREASIRPPEGTAGAPFVIFYGEVNEDGDGPIEWCWPVAEQDADRLAAQFPELTLRTEAAHQEAYIFQGLAAQFGPAQGAVAAEKLLAWVKAERRQPSGGMRLVYLSNPANEGKGPDCDLAITLR